MNARTHGKSVKRNEKKEEEKEEKKKKKERNLVSFSFSCVLRLL